MRAAVFYGGRDIRVEEVPTPLPLDGEVLVEVRAAGICGSDLHRYRGHDPWGSTASSWFICTIRNTRHRWHRSPILVARCRNCSR